MWPNPQETADLITFTEEIFNEKVHFFVQCVLLLWDQQYLKNMVKHGVYKPIKNPIPVELTDSVRLYWLFWNSIINSNYRTWCKI